MKYHDREYTEALTNILTNGYRTENRTGVGTITNFGLRMEFDLTDRFPLLTGKRLHWKSIVEELLWFMRGQTNVKHLQERGVTIWDEWANEWGDLGPIYGAQWRAFSHEETEPYSGTHSVDQLAQLVKTLRSDPQSRRMVVSAWNPLEIPQMALPPCHVLFQCHVAKENRLDLQIYQRSCDFFLGVPFNIASYALLTHILAHMSNREVGRLIWVGGDCHIYLNHIEPVQRYLSRELRASPKLLIDTSGAPRGLEDWAFDDFDLIDYNPHPSIKADVAV